MCISRVCSLFIFCALISAFGADFVDALGDGYAEAKAVCLHRKDSRSWGKRFGVVVLATCDKNFDLGLEEGDRFVSIAGGAPLCGSHFRLFNKDEPLVIVSSAGTERKASFWGAVLSCLESKMSGVEVFDPADIPARERTADDLRVALLSCEQDPVLAEAALAHAQAEHSLHYLVPALGGILRYRQGRYQEAGGLLQIALKKRMPDEPARYAEWLTIQCALLQGDFKAAIQIVKRSKVFKVGLSDAEPWKWAAKAAAVPDVLTQAVTRKQTGYTTARHLKPVGRFAKGGEYDVASFKNRGYSFFRTVGTIHSATDWDPAFHDGKVDFTFQAATSKDSKPGMYNALEFRLITDLEDRQEKAVLALAIHTDGEVVSFVEQTGLVLTAHLPRPLGAHERHDISVLVIDDAFSVVADGMEIMRGALGQRDAGQMLYTHIGFPGISGRWLDMDITQFGPQAPADPALASWVAMVHGDLPTSLALATQATEGKVTEKWAGILLAKAHLRLKNRAGIDEAMTILRGVTDGDILGAVDGRDLVDDFLEAGATAEDLKIFTTSEGRSPFPIIAQLDVALLQHDLESVGKPCLRLRKWFPVKPEDVWYDAYFSARWAALAMLTKQAKPEDFKDMTQKMAEYPNMPSVPANSAYQFAVGTLSEATARKTADEDPNGGVLSFYLGIQALQSGREEIAKKDMRAASRLGDRIWEGRLAAAMLRNWDVKAPVKPSDF